MNINDLTLGEIKNMHALFNQCNDEINDHVGEKVIVRTYSAGVWFGKLEKNQDME